MVVIFAYEPGGQRLNTVPEVGILLGPIVCQFSSHGTTSLVNYFGLCWVNLKLAGATGNVHESIY